MNLSRLSAAFLANAKSPRHMWGALALLLAAFVLLASLYRGAIPHFEGPDEHAHLAYVNYLRQTRTLPQMDAATAAISHQLVQQPPLFYLLATLATLPTSPQAALAAAEVNPYLQKGLSVRAHITPPAVPPSSGRATDWARLVSLVGGLLTVAGTWLLARRLLPNHLWAAYVAAALVGFNPQFLFSSATITNDTWAAALPVWALWAGVGAAAAMSAHPQEVWRHAWAWAGVGALLGAAILTKYSAATVALPLALVWLLPWLRVPRPPRRAALVSALAALGGFVLVAGWWLARNIWLFGELVPLAAMVDLLPAMARPDPLPWSSPEVWRGVRWLLRSYWGVFGYGIIAPAAYHGVVQNLLLVTLLGYGVLVLRIRWDRAYRPGWAVLLALVWSGAALLGLIQWMRLMLYTDQGRLLFPAAGGIALLITLGLGAWLPRRWLSWGAPVVVGLMLGLGIWQWHFLRDRYAQPPPLATPVAMHRPIQARFVGGMTLLGADFPQGAAVAPGAPLPITLYWRTEAIVEANYTLFIHLADGANQLLYQFDGVPFGGRHSTRQWVPGETFADSYLIPLTASPDASAQPSGLATLSLGFYPVEAPTARQAAIAVGDGAPIGDRVVLAMVRLTKDRLAEDLSGELQMLPVAQWQNGIMLAEVDVAYDAVGTPRRLDLQWQTSQVIQQEYTVFVQLLDAQNQVLAQRDQPPLAGSAPTATWRAGDKFEDHIELPLTPDATGAWQSLILGLYAADGVRLGIVAPEAGDAVVILRRAP